jgi:hypothetical protein
MSGEYLLTAVVAALATLVTAAGVFMAKSRLSDVMASPSGREETAVDKMAALLDKLADFQSQREIRLFDLQDKALGTVATMTVAVKEVTMSIQGLDMRSRQDHLGMTEGNTAILASMENVSGQLESIGRLVSDLALEVIKERGTIKEGKTRNAIKD